VLPGRQDRIRSATALRRGVGLQVISRGRPSVLTRRRVTAPRRGLIPELRKTQRSGPRCLDRRWRRPRSR
jgi:hypothetical protein